jgi:epoxyqueuosine reductase
MDPGFPVAAHRFDQRNEVFKRCAWDESMRDAADRFYRDVGYREKAGYRQVDYALRNSSWTLEWAHGMGNSRSDSGLYSWAGLPDKMRAFAEAGGTVELAPRDLARVVKRTAGFLGADLVGVSAVHPTWVYSHEFDLMAREHRPLELPDGCDKAVVMAVAMDYAAMRSAPTGVGGAATGLGYSRMAFVAGLLAVFIRSLGYQAIPCGNDTALSIPLALAAGLGESSRMGLLVTPEYGPRVRLCKVFTDMPMETDEYRPFGVVDFCRACRKCAEHCPSRAVPEGDMTTDGPNISSHSGPLKWYVDCEKCFSFWARNRMDCTTCIRVCPFNKEPGIIHDLARTVVRRAPYLSRGLVWLDDALGYGRQRPADEWWGG